VTIKNPTSFRLSDKAVECLAQLADHLGVSRTSVLELALRQLARREMGGARQGKRPKGK
jgi:predicted transcriptional regulator